MGWAFQTEEELCNHLAERLCLFPTGGLQLEVRFTCHTYGSPYRGSPLMEKNLLRRFQVAWSGWKSWSSALGVGLLSNKIKPSFTTYLRCTIGCVWCAPFVKIISPFIWINSINTLRISMTKRIRLKLAKNTCSPNRMAGWQVVCHWWLCSCV